MGAEVESKKQTITSGNGKAGASDIEGEFDVIQSFGVGHDEGNDARVLRLDGIDVKSRSETTSRIIGLGTQ